MSIKSTIALESPEDMARNAIVFVNCISEETYVTKLKHSLSQDGQDEIRKYKAGKSITGGYPNSAADVWRSLHKSDQELITKFLKWANQFRWEWSLVRCERKETDA